MQTKIEQFFSEIKGKRVTVLGIGVSNTDVIKLLMKKEAIVTACDKNSEDKLGNICAELRELGVTLVLGEQYLANIQADIVIRSPGIYFNKTELINLRKKGVIVTSEMELFFGLCPCKTIAVTGSDGKTTTTTIIAEFLKAEGKTVHLGGNIGRALFPIIEEIMPEDVAVVELSSFQLLSMRESPDIAVVTNVAPNHLDVHGDMSEYIEAKKNILGHQNAFSRSVLNLDNEITVDMQSLVRGELLCFSRLLRPAFGAYLSGSDVLMSLGEQTVEIMNEQTIKLPGVHNVENYLAAISAVWGMVQLETIRTVAIEFGGVEHRIEFVGEINGVRYYNDSIATSPTRTIAGLNSFNQKIIVIAGGYDKNIPYAPLAPFIVSKVKVLVLMGATAGKIEQAVINSAEYALQKHDSSQLTILHADNMEDAVAKATAAAKLGDIISLSPASASFDLYENFELRGRHFKAIVGRIPLASHP